MMPRRDRRSGVRFIEDGRDRSLTFFKRRSGLFKAASDLSTLTGARVAVVLESEHGKFSSFGTPEASPILDAFLLGSAPTDLDTSEAEKASITNLQNEVFQLEKDKTMEDKRKKESMARTNEKIQEASKMAKYVYGNIEDLDATELFDMYRELSRVKQEINDRLPTLLHEDKVEAGDRLRDPSLLQPTWWRSMPPPQVATPPKYPWTPFQAYFQQHPWSSTSASVLARSGSSLPNSVILPSPQVPQNPLQHYYPLAPHTPSTSSVQFQAPKTPPAPMEAAHNPYSYHIRGIDTNGNSSHPFSLSPILSSSTTPQPSSLQTTPPSDDSSPLSLSPQISSPLHLGSSSQQLPFSYNTVQPPQHYANVGSTSIHSHQLFYSNLSSPELNVEFGNIDKTGGTQVGGGHNERFGLSSPQQSDGGFDGVMPKSFSAGESSGGGHAGGNLGGLKFPWY
ncbi:transcription factor RLM1-like [Miscanthus floridulus]|uniref:transcription factor RLM1-like n=1 Tax=Miscanthus floridulus TaxID=154761 RepID=UPI0034594495